MAPLERQRSNMRLAVKLGFVALFFTAFGFGMVPLYDVICKITGLNGKTKGGEKQGHKTQLDRQAHVAALTLQRSQASYSGRYFHIEPKKITKTMAPLCWEPRI